MLALTKTRQLPPAPGPAPVAREKPAPKKTSSYSFFSFDFLILLAAILITTNATSLLLYNDGGDQESKIGSALVVAKASGGVSNALRQVLLSPLYLYAIYYLAIHREKALRLLIKSWPLTVISLLSILSTIWSIEPSSTLRRSLSLVGGTGFAFYLATRYTLPQFVRLLGICMGIVCLLTFFGVFVTPEMGIHHDKHFPAWRGYFGHKNQLGNTMDCALLIGLMLIVSKYATRVGWAVVIMSLILVAGSLSRSAWVLAGFTIVSAAFMSLARRDRPLATVLFVFAVMGVAAFILFGDPAKTYDAYMVDLGKDPTLSGRTVIWMHILDLMRGFRFWIGYGYDSFWTSAKGALSMNWGLGDFVPSHAHNGWLQVFIHFGIVGVILLVIGFVNGLRANLTLSLRGDNLLFSTGLIYIFLYLCINLTETTFMWRDHFQWIMFIYFCASATQYKFAPVPLTAPAKKVLRRRSRPESHGESQAQTESPQAEPPKLPDAP